MTLSVEVWSSDDPGTVKIGDLTEDFGRTFQEVYRDVGAGTVVLPRASADVSKIVTNRWLKFRYNGLVAFSMRVGPRRQHTIAQGEEAEQVLTISGPGGLAALKDAATHHHTSTGVLAKEADTRWFNFASIDYPDWQSTPWIAAKALYRQDDAASPYGFDVPEGWPDGTAYWMWGTTVGGGSPPHAIGDCYFRTTFAAVTEGDYSIFFAADDGGEVWVDGVQLHAQVEAFAFRQTIRIDRFLAAGTHTIAIKGTNIERAASPSTNRAGVLIAVYRTTNGGELDTLAVHSDSTWKALAYPASPPGFTPGELLGNLFEEAVARGALDVWLTSFSDTHDSAGVLWTGEVDIGIRIGETLLDVLRKLAEASIDFRADYNLIRLLVYNLGGLNTGAAVTLIEGVQIEDLDHDYEPIYVSDLLVHQADGTYTEVASGAAAIPANGTHPRVEALLEAGSAPSAAAATRMATGVFADNSSPQTRVNFTVLPAAGYQPFADWWPGKRITVPDMSSVGHSTLIESLTISDVSEEESGEVGGIQVAVGEGVQ